MRWVAEFCWPDHCLSWQMLCSWLLSSLLPLWVALCMLTQDFPQAPPLWKFPVFYVLFLGCQGGCPQQFPWWKSCSAFVVWLNCFLSLQPTHPFGELLVTGQCECLPLVSTRRPTAFGRHLSWVILLGIFHSLLRWRSWRQRCTLPWLALQSDRGREDWGAWWLLLLPQQQCISLWSPQDQRKPLRHPVLPVSLLHLLSRCDRLD